MTVLRYCCFALGILATVDAANAVAQSEVLAPQRAGTRPTLVRQEIIRQAELNVLRQKVSIPLDQLTQPVSLAEWQKVAQIAPQVSVRGVSAHHPRIESQPTTPKITAHESLEPESVPSTEAASNPFADDPVAEETSSKIQTGKLIGIVGRALFESAPVPSLEGLREHMPEMPIPAAGGAPPAAVDADFGASPAPGDPFGSDADFAPVEESDPFSAPPTEADEPPANGETPETPEEDPFG